MTDRRAAEVASSPAITRVARLSRVLAERFVRAAILARDAVLTLVVVCLCTPLWILPWRTAVVVGRAYGLLVGAAWPLGRRVGIINLSRAFGDSLSHTDAMRGVWSVWSSLGAAVAEGLQFSRRFKRGQGGWTELAEAEDPDLLQRIIGDPRPKIFVTAHFGSWELAVGLAALHTGHRGAAIVRRVDNPFLNAIVRRARLSAPDQWIEKMGGGQVALDRLQRGDNIALLLDENAGPRGVFVDFFGRPASTSRLAGLLSMYTGCPIVIGVCVRRPAKPFLFRLALIEPPDQPQHESVAAITQALVSTLERWVREDPWQWRWVHWRWKTRPDRTEESYGRRELEECIQAWSTAVDDSTRSTVA